MEGRVGHSSSAFWGLLMTANHCRESAGRQEGEARSPKDACTKGSVDPGNTLGVQTQIQLTANLRYNRLVLIPPAFPFLGLYDLQQQACQRSVNMSQRAAGAPVAVLQAALQSFVEGPAGTATKFIPASKFVLAKPGYYFSAGPQGTGWVVGSDIFLALLEPSDFRWGKRLSKFFVSGITSILRQQSHRMSWSQPLRRGSCQLLALQRSCLQRQRSKLGSKRSVLTALPTHP